MAEPRAFRMVEKMPAIIMDGRALSDRLKPELRQYADELLQKHKYVPLLAAIQIGNDPASRQYVRNKRRFAGELGFRSELVAMPPGEASTERLMGEIAQLNADCSTRLRRRRMWMRLAQPASWAFIAADGADSFHARRVVF